MEKRGHRRITSRPPSCVFKDIEVIRFLKIVEETKSVTVGLGETRKNTFCSTDDPTKGLINSLRERLV